MQIEGNVYKVGEVQSGTSQQGNQWRRQNVVVEYYENPTDMWTQKIVLQLGGNHIDEYHLKVGDKVRVRFGLYANEWQGKYFPHSLRPYDAMCVLKRSTKHCELFTHTNGMGREMGGRLRMGNTCTPMADSCQYMAKPLQYCKVISLQSK